MKNLSNKGSMIAMMTGLFIIALTQIISRMVECSDCAKGLGMGIGIGFLLLSFLYRKFATS